MMNMILTKIHKFGRIRQLHTIISQETIQPSCPTPFHLKNHNLSVIDKYILPIHMPWIFFYNNYKNGDINILKKSLSKCLIQYYPFAGRLPTTLSPHHAHCNDEGVEFLEASIDSRLGDFVFKREQDETLNQLIPHSLGCAVNKTSTSIVEVQLNHFICGGVALAVSIAHKVADAFTMLNFINHWATFTREGISPVTLSFSSSSISNSHSNTTKSVEPTGCKYLARRFVFTNSKLVELKNKINAMGTAQVNPTRVESLTSLLFKCGVRATETTSSSSQRSNLMEVVNLRGNIGSKFPKLGAGNMIANAMIVNSGQVKLNEVITSLRKQRIELQGIKDMEEAGRNFEKTYLTVGDGLSRTYTTSSICRFPIYQVDFGWGSPVRAILQISNIDVNSFVFMDTPSGDGIEAIVHLEEEDMTIFQQDKELLTYTQ